MQAGSVAAYPGMLLADLIWLICFIYFG